MDKDLVLVESSTRRSEVMECVAGDESALESLNKAKAKALVMATWQGQSVATTEQMAEFYEVPADTINTVFRRNREEFLSDGVKVVRGKKALGELTFNLNISSQAPSVKLWTPRAALRLGMLLRDSDVARQVRSLLLDIAQSANPAKAPAPVKPELAVLSVQETMAIVGEMSAWLPSRNIDEVMAAQWKFQVAASLCPQMKVAAQASVAMLRNANPLDGGMAPMNATEVAAALKDRIGIEVSAREVNKAAQKIGWLTQRIAPGGDKEWDLTPEGLKFGKQYPVTTTKWAGPQVRWSEAALDGFEAHFTGEDIISAWEVGQ